MKVLSKLLIFLLIVLLGCAKGQVVSLCSDDKASLVINAKHAALIDYYSGELLYGKAEHERVPPASMVKLVLLYVVLDEIRSGRFDLETEVPIDRKADWKNQPKRSSLMFLEEDDIVTVRELLLGLLIPSGNDAAVALAAFVARDELSGIDMMNNVAKKLSLHDTVIVEPSGYSSENKTTANEFAQFALALWKQFPLEVEEFCSTINFSYPHTKNMPPSRTTQLYPKEDKNHNELLGRYDGVVGLKTGYIDQSGANVALAFSKDGTKFIAVMMGGPGSSSSERSLLRAIDGATLLTWAQNNYKALQFSGPLDLTITEKKSKVVYSVYSIASEYKTFPIKEIANMRMSYKIRPFFTKHVSALPTKVGRWKVHHKKQVIASGNLFVDTNEGTN